MLPKNWMNFAKKHKLIVAAGAILAIIVLAVVIPLILGWFQQSAAPTNYDRTGVRGAPSIMEAAAPGVMPTPAPGGGAYVEVKESSVTIETDDADNAAVQIRALTESLGGYVEDTRKYDTESRINVNMRARVPSAKFRQFTDNLIANYNEKEFSVSSYRLSTQRELDELDIIAASLADYRELRNRTMAIPLDEKQINLLFTLTQKELDLKSLEKQYTTALAGKKELADYSTVSVSLEQKKEVKIMPEDLGERLRLKAKDALDHIANSVMDLLTGSVAVFVSAIQVVIYVLLVAVPLIAGYRLLRKIYSAITARM